jgi:glycosyltransferase involved in cell wall biosynthesis
MFIGFDTQTHETKVFATGIQRVIRETHGWLADFLPISGGQVGWVNTVPRQRSYAFKTNPYLASDPVLNAPEAKLSEVDVLVITDIAMLLDVRAIQREKQNRQLKVVVLIYDIFPVTHPEWFPKESLRYFRLYLQKMLYIADQIVVTSQSVKDDLLALSWATEPKILVIHLGSFHAQRPSSSIPRSQISLISVSTVEPRKGHARLIEAFDELRAAGEDVNLHIVGKRGWAEEKLYRDIQSHPDFGARLRWHQDAMDPEVLTLASQCNIGVIPSDGEGFGMFLEEALTLGLKVVASDIPVFREREQPNVFFSPLTSTGLASTIVEAARTPWEGRVDWRVRSMRDFAEDLSNLLVGLAG